MSNTIIDFVDAVMPVIHDDAGKLTSGELARFVRQAIVGRYSSDAPLVLVSELSGNGTYFLDTPQAVEGQVGVFEPEFSIIREIEYPIERTPKETLLDADVSLYQTPTGFKIQIQSCAPSATEILRCTWTARHKSDGSTVPDKDFYAVADFAASLALEALAAIYVQIGDPAISADSVNYRTKSQEYRDLAKVVRRRYFNHVGVEESSTGGGGSDDRPAIAIGDMSLTMGSGNDRLMHGRYTR